MNNFKVSIVIPNWNGRDKLKKNLPSVLAVKDIHEVIVVDDGSTDDSIEIIRKNFPAVKLIIKPQNSGFSSTVNQGVRESSGDILFLLNSDASPAPEAVKIALAHFENPKVFSVSCATEDGNWSWAKFERGFLWHYKVPLPEGESPKLHQTLWASGGSGLFRKSIWEELTGFDELFAPFYEEDSDLGYRATKRGYLNLWDPDSKVEHYKQKGVIEENFSRSKISSVAQRNQLLLIWKNITDPAMLRQHFLGLLRMIISHPSYLKVFFSALVKLPLLLPKRAKESHLSKLKDSEILGMYP
ncbi:hypothetical protein A2631_02730 [Candidatus Daviesbacteria bacterium RIFCSPHIGHO2_01_FULL_44_29]|uniref:Glycosyltransferase 2-like domain-containing protein n=1 Tax=Candidatus Daviesbacteria bacterium RIFCSPHIGHO2_02_FULL_43_12 TaxID=1797776 RepID=A0A1F5KKE4_9BACT|nr:MAG: hypothetical protein A2631_02730 [Candidatus Daviesbacteria bacterium RIFCSPHIGHO2_01_FULL_44_29]OGE41299.1 MAG: hypothetical protein A3D25_02125 [Candidatus Daviesbacteria bacterium RIFCSPHIGHO2_02_FULL_43_12]OGE69500.1 MAG: hypothetical protein A3B55_03865 [Candidatus Daviesbacteria bacterium RIFCSPLOWO2_01_FULL_43_15]